MAYVYQHIRLDKNEPFYIGVGEDTPNEKGKYRRAYNTFHRNNFWKKIKNKTNYKVEILIDDISYTKALEKEIEFIALYGRKNIGKGPLCNLTDGGEGVKGIVKATKKVVQKDFDNNIIKVYDSIASVSKYGYSKSSVNRCCKGGAKTHLGYVWQYFDNQSDDLTYNKSSREIKNRKRIIQKNLDGSIAKIWDCMMDAIKNNPGCTSSGIGCCCNSIMRTHKGFMWEFENPANITRKGKSEFRTYKKVVQINPKTNLAVKIWENADRVEVLGFYPEYITGCCKGKYKTRYGYKWEYFDETQNYQFEENHEIQDNEKIKEKRKIAQIDLETNEIVNIFNSIHSAKKFGFSEGGIWRCLQKNNNIHKGFKWKYLHKI